MRGWPVRGGCGRRMFLVGLVVLLPAGCSSGGSGNSGSAAPADEAGPVEPALCDGDVVISGEAADTAEPATVVEMQARLLVSPPKNPAGYRGQAVIVDEGLGSFRISTPSGFSTLWRNGTSPEALLEVSASRDRSWTEFWRDRMESDELNTRAIAVDSDRTDEVVALLITMTPGMPEAGQEMADVFAESYEAGGFSVRESCGVRANGHDGAYVEHIVPAETLEGPNDRTQLQFLIPDPPNDALWGVTCDVTEGSAVEVKQLCREIASTFEPLPEVIR